MADIISVFCILFALGGNIYGSEIIQKRYIRILPQDVVAFYQSLVDNGMDPDEAAVKAIKIASFVKKSEEKAK